MEDFKRFCLMVLIVLPLALVLNWAGWLGDSYEDWLEIKGVLILVFLAGLGIWAAISAFRNRS